MKQFFAGLIIGAFIVAFLGMWCMAQLEQEIAKEIEQRVKLNNSFKEFEASQKEFISSITILQMYLINLKFTYHNQFRKDYNLVGYQKYLRLS